MTEKEIDLSSLNQIERELLRLLARGHTVKSIANQLGRSSGSVNERLREARRKTGIGSSRELSRLLVAQENRDKKTGVATEERNGATKAEDNGRKAKLRNYKGALLMISILATVIAGTALFVQSTPDGAGGPTPGMQDDPLLADMPAFSSMPRAQHPQQQYVRLRSQVRDQNWAPQTEVLLKGAYAELLDRYDITGSIRVLCAESVCEVAFKVVPTSEKLSAFMQALQGEQLHDKIAKMGLEGGSMGFISNNKNDQELTHFAYWSKNSP
ncbi:MAG: helix-turn-helix transcriptional regulator [Allopontixanthobacter sediminis]